ncbi:MAG: 23S rRNA (adenine(2503)-C(2))-methyltransferase RlmN [Bacteroidales bacterium]|nr:23S rRNA (adenine(2503)-C(2))-methyltransferase RlmN [Bacteroidales bacterium]
METSDRKPLIGLTLAELQQVAVDNGLPRFAGAQIAQWLYEKRVRSIDEMTNLSKAGRARLAEHYCVGYEEPKAEARSTDGTVKYLFNGAGGRDVEAVFIPDKERATLCVSSQAGCKMNCAFCMTGRQGFHGQLSTHQILNQIMAIPRSQDLTNLVFMGMGEPLDNLEPVLKAIEILTAKWGFAWSPKRITVSTIGKLPELQRLIEETKVHIALSVHNPISQQRAQIMPVERAFPVRSVVEMLRQYDFAHQRRLSVEYIMWAGENDSMRYADALAHLMQGTSARVNLIRFHSIPGSDLKPCPMSTMEAFRDRLNSLGVTATIRASRGEDIMAACGMLAGRQKQ